MKRSEMIVIIAEHLEQITGIKGLLNHCDNAERILDTLEFYGMKPPRSNNMANPRHPDFPLNAYRWEPEDEY